MGRLIKFWYLSLLTLVSTIFPDCLSANTINNEFQISSKDFVQNNSIQQFSYNGKWNSSDYIENSKIKSFELGSDFFIENSKLGDWSFDIDPFVYRKEVMNGHFWIGRSLPQREYSRFALELETSSAIGSVWAQNLIKPLQPRVSGWIGTGVRTSFSQSSPFSYSLAYSPLFVPARSPQLDIENPQDRSLYARTLPQKVVLSDMSEPMMINYQLNIDSILDIVFQSQVFASLSWQNKNSEFHLSAWQAPRPEVVAKSKERLVIEDLPSITVEVIPQFPVQRHISFDYIQKIFNEGFFRAQVVYTFDRDQKDFSLEIAPNQYLKMGASHRLDPEENKTDPLYYQSYTNSLGWFKIQTANLLERFNFIFNVNQHFAKGFEGFWYNPEIQLRTFKNLTTSLSMNLIAGKDKAYYGDWRNLDSLEVNMRYQW